MTVSIAKVAKSHDDVLEEIADALDIPPTRFEQAVSRYESLGTWLDRPESSLAKYDPAISPQGSFLLGTVTRPLNANEEYDVDLVCLLKASKTEFTQKRLKDAVGAEVALYAKARNMANPPEEGRRCWTLNYADGAQFHMDILPALPDAQRYQAALMAEGHRILASDISLSGQAIAITDTTLPQYTQVTDDWPQSNPMGYAAWFRSRMRLMLNERKQAYAKLQMITASVDEIPDYKVKTPLQRAIQLLKRHRDGMFANNGEHKPISIIITTLAAHAYNNEASISAALQSILTGMENHIEKRGGVMWVANPVNPSENFADKWAEKHQLHENFMRWLAQAKIDFALYLRASQFVQLPNSLRDKFGPDLVDRTLATLTPDTFIDLVAPALITSDSLQRAENAAEQIQRVGVQSKPWAQL